MTTETETTSNDLVDAYLQRLRTASADLPEATRAELVDNICAHIAETAPVGADEATTRQALDELGTPEAIAAAARAEVGIPFAPAAGRSGETEVGRFYDVATVLVLLLGGVVVPVLGWVAGVVMLWAGPRWTTGEKVVGTALLPVAALAALGLAVSVPQSLSIVAALSLVVGVGVGVVLALIVLLQRARARA